MKSRPRALGALLLTFALLTGLMVPALAASTATYLGTGEGANVSGTLDGSSWSNWAGEMRMRLDDGSDDTLLGYCVDIHNGISSGQSGMAEQDWDESGIDNLPQVAYILNTYDSRTNDGGLVGNRARKAAAIQAAIWHFTDGFDLNTSSGNHTNIVTNYQMIVAAAEGASAPEPTPSLAFSPSSGDGYVGMPAGPFTVATTASSVPLTISGAPAATVTNGSGTEITEVGDGDEFWVNSPNAGAVTVSASISTTIEAGRVFFAGTGIQRLILADSSTASSDASVTVTFDLQDGQPVSPVVEVSEECGVPDQITIPTTPGVQYLLDGTPITDGEVVTGPDEGTVEHTLTAEARDGYQLEDDSWSHTFELSAGEPCPAEVAPVSPTVQQSEECDQPDTLTIPTTEGVQYLLDGTPIDGGEVVIGPDEGATEHTLTAEALNGFQLEDPTWSHTFELSAGDTCTEAVAPTLEAAEECDVPDQVTVPETEGVQYLLDGEPVDPGTVVYGPDEGEVEHTLTAVALDGYQLTNPEWSHTLVLTAGEPCPDPVVAPAATIAAECLDDEGQAVTVTLDNSDSEVDVTYVVTVAGTSTDVDVAAGEIVEFAAEVAAGTGEFDVDVEVAGEVIATASIDTANCETEVAGVIIEDETEESTDEASDDTPPTEVLGVSIEADEDELAQTGLTLLPLLLLGLFGVAAGGALVGRRR